MSLLGWLVGQGSLVIDPSMSLEQAYGFQLQALLQYSSSPKVVQPFLQLGHTSVPPVQPGNREGPEPTQAFKCQVPSSLAFLSWHINWQLPFACFPRVPWPSDTTSQSTVTYLPHGPLGLLIPSRSRFQKLLLTPPPQTSQLCHWSPLLFLQP